MASSPLPHLSTFIVRNGFLEVEACAHSEIVQRVRAGVADTDSLVLVSWELFLLHRVADVRNGFTDVQPAELALFGQGFWCYGWRGCFGHGADTEAADETE